MVLSQTIQLSSGAYHFTKTSKAPIHSWGFPMPLTPPSSPVLDSTSPDDDDDFDCCFRIQPVCGIYDDITEEHAYAQANGMDIPLYTRPGKSVVIKDCMWGHWSTPDVTLRLQEGDAKCKLDRSVLPDTVDDAMDTSSSKLVGVDPSEVFPHHEDSVRVQGLTDCSSDSEDESDIDVVTVESSFTLSEESSKPESPAILSPPKTPDAEPELCPEFQPLAINSPFQQSPTKLKLDVPQAVVKSLSALADKGRSKSPRKQLNGVSDLKFSRTSHNVLERKRRNELKMRFFQLRDAIPELSENDKVPKVTILKQAILYLRTLKTEEKVLEAEQQRQRKLNAELRRKVALLLKHV